MINLDMFRKLIRLLIGDKAIKMLDRDEWQEFTEYGNAIVALHNDGVNQMAQNGGTVDLKSLNELHNDFNSATMRFVNRLTFGKDQNGEKVSFVKLFGEILTAHPVIMPSLCARFLFLWAVEHKINMKYRELYEDNKPKYSSVTITNYTDLPEN